MHTSCQTPANLPLQPPAQMRSCDWRCPQSGKAHSVVAPSAGRVGRCCGRLFVASQHEGH